MVEEKKVTKPAAAKKPQKTATEQKKPADKTDSKKKAAEPKKVEEKKPVEAKKIVEKKPVEAKKPVEPKKPVVTKPKPIKKKPSLKKKKKIDIKYILECTNPVDDGILKVDNLVDFLKESIKFNGKKGQLALGGIEVSSSGKTRVVVTTTKSELSKRYLKYLTKKYLKRHSLRDWIRVVASDKNTYEMRYFQINDDEEGSEASDD